MDETLLPFDLYNNTTIDKTGAKAVPIRSNNSEDIKASLVLAIISDGRKLKPMIIFSGKGTYLSKTLKSND